MQAKSPSTPASARPETPRRLTEVSTPVNSGDGKKLTVGRDIALSGSINSCERLIVEGSVEADLTDAITLEVAQGIDTKVYEEIRDQVRERQGLRTRAATRRN